MYILTIVLVFVCVVCIVLIAVLIETKRKLRISEMLKESAIRSDNHNAAVVDRMNIEIRFLRTQLNSIKSGKNLHSL